MCAHYYTIVPTRLYYRYYHSMEIPSSWRDTSLWDDKKPAEKRHEEIVRYAKREKWGGVKRENPFVFPRGSGKRVCGRTDAIPCNVVNCYVVTYRLLLWLLFLLWPYNTYTPTGRRVVDGESPRFFTETKLGIIRCTRTGARDARAYLNQGRVRNISNIRTYAPVVELYTYHIRCRCSVCGGWASIRRYRDTLGWHGGLVRTGNGTNPLRPRTRNALLSRYY